MMQKRFGRHSRSTAAKDGGGHNFAGHLKYLLVLLLLLNGCMTFRSNYHLAEKFMLNPDSLSVWLKDTNIVSKNIITSEYYKDTSNVLRISAFIKKYFKDGYIKFSDRSSTYIHTNPRTDEIEYSFKFQEINFRSKIDTSKKLYFDFSKETDKWKLFDIYDWDPKSPTPLVY